MNNPNDGPMETLARTGNLAGIETLDSSFLRALSTLALIVREKKRRLGMFFTSLREVLQQSPNAKMLGLTAFAFPFPLESELITWK
jgi:hypothetical protein